jgi:hypothetical protein
MSVHAYQYTNRTSCKDMPLKYVRELLVGQSQDTKTIMGI